MTVPQAEIDTFHKGNTTYGVWIRKMMVPQAEIDTFHLRTNFRQILPLGHRRCLWTQWPERICRRLGEALAELRISTRLGEALAELRISTRLGEALAELRISMRLGKALAELRISTRLGEALAELRISTYIYIYVPLKLTWDTRFRRNLEFFRRIDNILQTLCMIG